jgi:hypothetical protein
MMAISSGAAMSSGYWRPMRRWYSAQPRSAPVAVPTGMMIPKVPPKLKVEVRSASCCGPERGRPQIRLR